MGSLRSKLVKTAGPRPSPSSGGSLRRKLKGYQRPKGQRT